MTDMQGVANIAIRIASVKKKFLLYHERHQTIKETVLARRRSSYTELWALNDVSYEFKKGRTYGIIGENGSGKSTLLKMATRILRPDEGTVEINGRISALLELGAGFHPDLTGRENIYLNGAILRLSKAEIDDKYDDIVAFSEIGEFIDTPVKNYSSGMYMRLGFSIAVNVDPDILLIDEVLAVGDEAFQKKCFEKLKTIQDSGKTIIFVSHDAESVRSLCDEAILMDDGKIAASGDVDTVVDRYHAMLSSRESGAPKTKLEGPDAGRYGTFEGRITTCSITGADGIAQSAFNRGDKLTLAINTLFETAVEKPIIGYIISKSDGARAYTTNTLWRGIDLGNVTAGTSIDFESEFTAHLCGGEYHVTLAIAHADASRFYDWWERAATFVVADDKGAQGIADLQASVTVDFNKARSE